jgi:hypothetical protein
VALADCGSDQPPNAKGDGGGNRPERELAQRSAQGRLTGQASYECADTCQRGAGEDRRGDDRAETLSHDERQEGNRCPQGEQQKRSRGGNPGGSTKLVGIDPKLLTRHGFEGRSSVATNDAMSKSSRVFRRKTLRFVDCLKLVFFIIRRFFELGLFEAKLVCVQLPRALHAEPLAERHRESPRQEPCDAGDEDGASHAAGTRHAP